MPSDPIRILIVDDEPHMRRLNEFSLRRGGFETFYFGQNGLEALELAEEVRPHLIIIDFRMPEMDGLSAMLRLKACSSTSAIPVIMVSGCGEFHAHRNEASAVAYAVLTKPYSPTQLVETAHGALAQRNPALAA